MISSTTFVKNQYFYKLFKGFKTLIKDFYRQNSLNTH